MHNHLKVVPYIKTLGINRFKAFLEQPFRIDMLCHLPKDSSVNVIFDGWKGKDMLNWYKLINEDKVVLEFYNDYYIIKTKIDLKLPFPRSINEFINDMDRHNIVLYWSDFVYENFEPKEYLKQEEISQYFIDLLNKMEKGFELNLK